MPVNHLMIAVGGTGGKCMYAFRQLVFQNAGRKLEPETANVRYLWIDSSGNDLDNLHKSFAVLGGSVDLPESSKVKISGNLAVRDVLAQPTAYPSIASWLGDAKNFSGILNVAGGASLEASQIRRLGRMLFAQNAPRILAAVRDQIREMRNTARTGLPQDRAVDIHILTGLGGGTGSGSVVDLVAACRREFPEQAVRIFVYAMLPEEHPESGKAGQNFHANGYAALRELNALAVGQWSPHNVASPKGERIPALDDPFNACFLFTEDNEHRQLDVRRELPETVATFLHQLIAESRRLRWEAGDVWGQQLAFMVGGNARRPERSGGRTNRPVRTRWFMSFGIRTIVVPQTEIQELLTYSYCESAANQQLFNNWDDELGFVSKAANHGFSITVRSPEYRMPTGTEDAFLTLEAPLLAEEQRQNWTAPAAYWEAVGPAFERAALDRDFPLQMGQMHEGFRDAFDTKYRGRGVKPFYDLMRRQNMMTHAAEIRRRVEADLRQRWIQGDIGLLDAESLLKEMIQACEDWRAEHQRMAEDKSEKGKRGAEIDAALVTNNANYAKCGIASRATGTHKRLVATNRVLNQEKFLRLTQSEGHRYAADLLPQVVSQVTSLLDEVTSVRKLMSDALGAFTSGRNQRCRDEEANRFDRQQVKFYNPADVRAVAGRLQRDKAEQRRQTSAIRENMEGALLPKDWTFLEWSRLGQEEITRHFELECERTSAQGHDSLIALDRTVRPVLGANIVDELQRGIGGDEDSMRNFARETLAGAKNLLLLNAREVDLVREGAVEAAADPANAVRYTTTSIIFPDGGNPAFRAKLASHFKGAVEGQAVGITATAVNPARGNEITVVRITSVMPARFSSRVALLKKAYDDAIATDPGAKITELHLADEAYHLPDLFVPTFSPAAMRPLVWIARHVPVGTDAIGPVHLIEARPNPATGRDQFYQWSLDAYGALQVDKEFGASEEEIIQRSRIEDYDDLSEILGRRLETDYRHATQRETLFARIVEDYRGRTAGMPANDARVVELRIARDAVAALLELERKTAHA